jgi:threonine dehydratase
MIRHVLPPTSAQLDEARRVVADHLQPTPTPTLNINSRAVYAKLESLQVTGSFKIRGALAAVDAARRADPTGMVITSSAGNHGLGVAHAAMILGVRATVVVPANASVAKVAKLRRYDVELIQIGTSYDDAQAHALELAQMRSVRYISPFNDTHVIAGQATVLDEMLNQAPDIEHVVISVGGGGLLSGSLLIADERGCGHLRFTGVQPENSAALYHVLRGATTAEVVHGTTIADGLAGGGDDGAATNAIIAQYKTPLVLVPEVNIRSAVRDAAENSGLVLEGSASASYAAIAHNLIDDTDSKVGFFATGRNIATELLVELLGEKRP